MKNAWLEKTEEEMNPAKRKAEEYIQRLIATPNIATCTRTALCGPTLAAHDAYTRLLKSNCVTPTCVDRTKGGMMCPPIPHEEPPC